MSQLNAVRTSVSKARGLPNEHYTDPAMWEREKTNILFASWSAIGFGKDVPQPGDAAPVDFLGVPLAIVRDKDGTLRVFQNTCRHRGMILIQEKGPIRGAIRCPYHSWCYALDGALRSTPHVGGPGQNTHEDIDRATLGLIEVPSFVFMDVVFVNVSGTAAPFEEVHRDLLDRWREFSGQPLTFGGEESGFELDVKTNWKLAVENYCESYHLPWVHPGLNSYSRLEDHYHIEEPDQFSGQGTLVYRQLELAGQKFADFDDLSAHWDTGAEYVALYPNVLLGVHRDHTFAIILEPHAMEHTVERIALYYAEGMEGPDYAGLRAKNAAQWKDVFEEDIFVVEGMQRGRHGPLFDGGKFSPAMDGPTHLFHHWIATRLDEAALAAE